MLDYHFFFFSFLEKFVDDFIKTATLCEVDFADARNIYWAPLSRIDEQPLIDVGAGCGEEEGEEGRC